MTWTIVSFCSSTASNYRYQQNWHWNREYRYFGIGIAHHYTTVDLGINMATGSGVACDGEISRCIKRKQRRVCLAYWITKVCLSLIERAGLLYRLLFSDRETTVNWAEKLVTIPEWVSKKNYALMWYIVCTFQASLEIQQGNTELMRKNTPPKHTQTRLKLLVPLQGVV